MKRFRDTKYLVTEDGRIWSEYTNRFLKPCNNAGYQNISLGGGKKNKRFIHRMVAECYIENPNNYEEVNHINNNRSDNRVENLEWCTTQMNTEHTRKQGRNSKGEEHAHSKVTETDVKEIRKIYANRELSQAKLGAKYGLCQQTVWEIVHNKIWKHVRSIDD